MFGGMMDPEMMRIAQEQMSRMRPEDLQRMQQQMLSNPDLLKMASEGMKNVRAEDLRNAAEQMKNIPPEQIAEMSSRMATASPDEIASMRARTDAQRSYEYQGALSLKAQGNQFHGIGKYSEAAERYLRAKSNLKANVSPEARNLQLTCSLNLMSCYLKTEQYHEVVAEGTEVLKGDSENLKALYRRGQAYRELKDFKLAVSDLQHAAELSPDDETVSDMLRQAREELDEEGGQESFTYSSDGPIIEEITDEEDAERMSPRMLETTTTENSEQLSTSGPGRPPLGNDLVMGDSLQTLSQNPEMLRSMQSMMSTMNPEHLAAMSGGGLTPDMAKMAAGMFKNMSPDELERMVSMSSQFSQALGGSSAATGSQLLPALERGGSTSTNVAAAREVQPSLQNSSQLSGQSFGEGMPTMANFTAEMQGQMREQMKSPAMKEMMASMLKGMSPEAMSSMSAQMGLKLSPEDAAQAQKAMSNFSPDDLDRLMVWADRAQRTMDQARRAKKWLLGRPGLILAFVLLTVAVVLQRAGYIG